MKRDGNEAACIFPLVNTFSHGFLLDCERSGRHLQTFQTLVFALVGRRRDVPTSCRRITNVRSSDLIGHDANFGLSADP
jgi:hypothetical protein